MGLDVVFKAEVGAAILASVVLTVRSAQRQGGDPLFVAGALAIAEHNALAFGLDWLGILGGARAALGSDVGALIDQALTLAPGARIASD